MCEEHTYLLAVRGIFSNFATMPQQLTIKQIATLAGVSVGTVDRVLHNRGRVSPEAMAAVKAVLETHSYRYNLHTSAVAFKKTKKSFSIAISIPSSEKGEYWDIIRSGLDKAFREYGDISVRSEYVFFDQFNALSCREAFESIAAKDYSAVILGTTFVDETVTLCGKLDEKHIPYVFVDGKVPGTNPIASYLADQEVCGRLLARLMDGLTAEGDELALLIPHRVGARISNNSAIRMQAFKSYFAEHRKDRVIREGFYSASSPELTRSEISAFLEENPRVGGVAAVISTGYIISDALSDIGKKAVVGGFDVTEGNARCVREGTLDFLIDQHPEQQGFNAVESLLHYLLYGAPDESLREHTPIDIVFLENLG